MWAFGFGEQVVEFMLRSGDGELGALPVLALVAGFLVAPWTEVVEIGSG